MPRVVSTEIKLSRALMTFYVLRKKKGFRPVGLRFRPVGLRFRPVGHRFRPQGLRFRPVGLRFRPQSLQSSVFVFESSF